MSIDKDTLSFGERAVITVLGEVTNFKYYGTMPQVDGLLITSASEGFTWNASDGRFHTTQIFYVQPLQAGDYEIGPVSMESGTRRVKSNTLTLHVKKPDGKTYGEIVFLKAEVPKKTVYVGELLPVTIRIYLGADITQSGDGPYAQSYTGFWHEKGDPGMYYSDTGISRNGTIYVGQTLNREFLFPNTSGTLLLPKYEYTAFVNSSGNRSDILRMDQQMDLVTAPQEITVLPLPDHDSLPGYNGDVGVFDLSSELGAETTNQWEPVRLRITVSGKGNFHFMMAPVLDLPDGLRAQLVSSTDTVLTLGREYTGAKTFVYSLVPEKPGDFDLSGIAYSYFDPYKEEYITLTLPGYKLHVAPGEKMEAETESNLPESFFSVSRKRSGAVMISSIIVLVLGSIILYVYTAKQKKKKLLREELARLKAEAEQEYVPAPDRSLENARAFIQSSTLYLQNGLAVQAVNALYEALIVRICGVTRMRKEEISVNTLKYRLGLAKNSTEIIGETMQLYEELKLKRYMLSPADLPLAHQLMKRTVEILEKLR